MPADKIYIQPDGRDDMPRGFGSLIGGQLDEAYLRLDGNFFEQVRGEHEGAVEDRDEQRPFAMIVFIDRGRHPADLFRDQPGVQIRFECFIVYPDG